MVVPIYREHLHSLDKVALDNEKKCTRYRGTVIE